MSEELQWFTLRLPPQARAEVERTAQGLFSTLVDPRIGAWWPFLRDRPAGTIPVATVTTHAGALVVNLRAATPPGEIPGFEDERPAILRRVAQIEAAGACPVVIEITVGRLQLAGVALVQRKPVGCA